MILWYAFGAIFIVWNVFQSPGLDFRLIALGALLPVVVDAPFGAQAYAHTLLAAVVVLLITMALTTGRGHRLRRRRALSLAIGWFCGLVLAGSWTHNDVFWWPLFGAGRPDAPLFGPWLLALRRREPLLRTTSWRGFRAAALENWGIALVRRGPGANALVVIAALLRGGTADLSRLAGLPRSARGRAWRIVLQTESRRFAPDPTPIRIDRSRRTPVLHFTRPGAAVLRLKRTVEK